MHAKAAEGVGVRAWAIVAINQTHAGTKESTCKQRASAHQSREPQLFVEKANNAKEDDPITVTNITFPKEKEAETRGCTTITKVSANQHPNMWRHVAELYERTQLCDTAAQNTDRMLLGMLLV